MCKRGNLHICILSSCRCDGLHDSKIHGQRIPPTRKYAVRHKRLAVVAHLVICDGIDQWNLLLLHIRIFEAELIVVGVVVVGFSCMCVVVGESIHDGHVHPEPVVIGVCWAQIDLVVGSQLADDLLHTHHL